jgi:hypothetical protein
LLEPASNNIVIVSNYDAQRHFCVLAEKSRSSPWGSVSK